MAVATVSVTVEVSVTEMVEGVTVVPESLIEKAEAREVVAERDSEKMARSWVPLDSKVAERRVGAVVSGVATSDGVGSLL